MVFDSIVETKKTESKVLKWTATCGYMVMGKDGHRHVTSYGTTKLDAVASAISAAYKKAIDEVYENNGGKNA